MAAVGGGVGGGDKTPFLLVGEVVSGNGITTKFDKIGEVSYDDVARAGEVSYDDVAGAHSRVIMTEAMENAKALALRTSLRERFPDKKVSVIKSSKGGLRVTIRIEAAAMGSGALGVVEKAIRGYEITKGGRKSNFYYELKVGEHPGEYVLEAHGRNKTMGASAKSATILTRSQVEAYAALYDTSIAPPEAAVPAAAAAAAVAPAAAAATPAGEALILAGYLGRFSQGSTPSREDMQYLQGYYHGPTLSREEAEKLLAGKGKDAWLLRYSNTLDEPVISYNSVDPKTGAEKVVHPTTDEIFASMTRDEFFTQFRTDKGIQVGHKK